jgi:2,4-didehydro-3-deoxy-L-rhamnonate hydrolase
VRLVTFDSDDGPRPGLVRDGDVIDIGSHYTSLSDVIVDGEGALARLREIDDAPSVKLQDARLRAPLQPRNIFCVGWNYLKHFEEGAAKRDEKLPEHPAFFSKASGTVIGPYDDIPAHEDVTRSLDYEVELTVVIGASGASITRESALDNVFGYTVGNDVSARDVQRRHGGQWLKGKSLDGTCPLGPWIVTRDEIPDPQGLEVGCRVNGEERQRSATNLMIFPVAELISRLSEGMTLQPGDVMLTGTPEGVAMGMEDPTYLSPGDVVECEVSSVGSLRNTVGGSPSAAARN